MKKLRPLPHVRPLGQGMVEFALTLPVLLLLIFGVIEFGRLLQAWLAIENAARFGVRYAATGKFDSQYCEDATTFYASHDKYGNSGTGYISAADDTSGGDDANNCNVPYPVTDYADKTAALDDYARVISARDAAVAGAAGIQLDRGVSAPNTNFGTTYAGSDDTQPGYFHVTIC